jgi:8-oxo-dGTP diphosphatase
MERPKVGVGIILVQDGKTLLGKRKNSHGEGQWAQPGGHLEAGESLEACVRRELLEETGITPLSFRQGPWTNDIMETKHYVTLWVFVHHFEGTPQLMEPHKCEGWEWFGWNEFPEPRFLSTENLIRHVGTEELIRLSSEIGLSELLPVTLDLLRNSSSVDFRVLLSLLFDCFRRGHIPRVYTQTD